TIGPEGAEQRPGKDGLPLAKLERLARVVVGQCEVADPLDRPLARIELQGVGLQSIPSHFGSTSSASPTLIRERAAGVKPSWPSKVRISFWVWMAIVYQGEQATQPLA